MALSIHRLPICRLNQPWMGSRTCRQLDCTTQFYIRDLSICDFSILVCSPGTDPYGYQGRTVVFKGFWVINSFQQTRMFVSYEYTIFSPPTSSISQNVLCEVFHVTLLINPITSIFMAHQIWLILIEHHRSSYPLFTDLSF